MKIEDIIKSWKTRDSLTREEIQDAAYQFFLSNINVFIKWSTGVLENNF